MIKCLSFLLIGSPVAAGVNAQHIKGRYAVRNVQTGKNIRPFEAGKSDGNKIILYNDHWWKCQTWDFVQVSAETYQLKNVYTGKALTSAAIPVNGVGLWQQSLKKDSLQYWDFISLDNKTFMIKLKGYDLYVTISSAKTNSSLMLMPKQNLKTQQWILIPQDPWW